MIGISQIDEPFRGLPMATGWFVVFLSVGIWAAAHAYDKQLVSLGVFAFILIAVATLGDFVFLFWLNGLLL